MITRGLDSARLVFSSPLLSHLTARVIAGRSSSAIRNFPASVCFRLGCVVNDDNFLWQAILVEGAPVGLSGASTLSRGLLSASGRGTLCHASCRVCRVVSRAGFLGVVCRARI